MLAGELGETCLSSAPLSGRQFATLFQLDVSTTCCQLPLSIHKGVMFYLLCFSNCGSDSKQKQDTCCLVCFVGVMVSLQAASRYSEILQIVIQWTAAKGVNPTGLKPKLNLNRL